MTKVLFLSCILWLGGCHIKVLFEPYQGDPLHIGMIGEFPDVREQQVMFIKMTFEELATEEWQSYDAIFIAPEFLSEASLAQYASVYQNSDVPFFFINCYKGHLAYALEDFNVDHLPDTVDGLYTTAVFQRNDQVQWVRYGLYNDEFTPLHLKDMYSRLFKDIASQFANFQ